MPKRDNQYRISVEIKVRPMKPPTPEQKKELEKIQFHAATLTQFLNTVLQDRLDEILSEGLDLERVKILPWKVRHDEHDV